MANFQRRSLPPEGMAFQLINCMDTALLIQFSQTAIFLNLAHLKNDAKIAVIILAAGASRRLGRAKQLVQYQGEPLLLRMIQQCQATDLGNLFVVLGARTKEISQALPDLPNVQLLENKNWAQGMGNTIGFAAREILLAGDFAGVCFVLSDQIHFRAELLGELIQEQKRSEKKIVLSRYKNGQGPPSYFDQSLFAALAELDGDDGAKAVVKKNKSDVGFIHFPTGEMDVDTEDDISRLRDLEQDGI